MFFEMAEEFILPMPLNGTYTKIIHHVQISKVVIRTKK